MTERPFNYTVSAEQANKLRATARTNGMEFLELTRRLITLSLVIDKVETDGGSVVIRTDKVEDEVRLIGDRSFLQKQLDRVGLQVVKPESIYGLAIPAELADEVKKIAKREQMPEERLLEEMINQGLRIVDAQASSDKQVVIKETGAESVLANIIPSRPN